MTTVPSTDVAAGVEWRLATRGTFTDGRAFRLRPGGGVTTDPAIRAAWLLLVDAGAVEVTGHWALPGHKCVHGHETSRMVVEP